MRKCLSSHKCDSCAFTKLHIAFACSFIKYLAATKAKYCFTVSEHTGHLPSKRGKTITGTRNYSLWDGVKAWGACWLEGQVWGKREKLFFLTWMRKRLTDSILKEVPSTFQQTSEGNQGYQGWSQISSMWEPEGAGQGTSTRNSMRHQVTG